MRSFGTVARFFLRHMKITRGLAKAWRKPPPEKKAGAMRILVFSTLYPNAAMPAHGVFVENRLRAFLDTVDADGKSHRAGSLVSVSK